VAGSYWFGCVQQCSMCDYVAWRGYVLGASSNLEPRVGSLTHFATANHKAKLHAVSFSRSLYIYSI
jgi:hypothetical protein